MIGSTTIDLFPRGWPHDPVVMVNISPADRLHNKKALFNHNSQELVSRGAFAYSGIVCTHFQYQRINYLHKSAILGNSAA